MYSIPYMYITCITIASVSLAVPTAPPGMVKLYPQSAYSIFVTWTLPPLVDRNGPITGFAIRHWKTDQETFSGSGKRVGSDLFFLLKDLQPYTDYNVEVAAVNVNGTGPFSIFQETKTLSARKSALCVETHLTLLSQNFYYSLFFYLLCTTC